MQGWHDKTWQKRVSEHWIAFFFIALLLGLLLLYAPVITGMGFVTDDYIEIGARYFDALDGLNDDTSSVWFERFINRSLIDPVTGQEIFRPARQTILAADYFIWQLEPFGYHLTNVLIYVASCFGVALLQYRLTRSRRIAIITALLFAFMPVHTAPVSEVASRGHSLAGLFTIFCVLYYVLPSSRRNTIAACVFLVLAIGSKETAIVTPALLALYELVFHRTELRKNPKAVILRQLPFWLITLGLVALRYYLFGRLSSSQFGLGSWEWTYQVQGYTLYALAPFLQDIFEWQTILIFIIAAILFVVYRNRGEVVYGFLWVPIALLVTYASPPQERYLFTPSVGLALALGSILAQPFSTTVRWVQWAAGLVTAAILVSMAYGSWQRILDYRNAGEIVAGVFRQVKTLHPTLPPDSRVYFTNLPEAIRRSYLFNSELQMQYALQMLYDDRTLFATRIDEFPITLDAPDRTYFFEYDRRIITERSDLVQSLVSRERCSDSSQNFIRWTFREGPEGWEPWSEIEAFEVRKGSLHLTTNGGDPFMGSPFIEVSPRDIDRVEIQMLATAAEPTFNAELFWQTAAMDDFSGQARTTFQVTADGETHTYSVPLDVRGDAPILRLRLDPANLPADIQLQRITLYCK